MRRWSLSVRLLFSLLRKANTIVSQNEQIVTEVRQLTDLVSKLTVFVSSLKDTIVQLQEQVSAGQVPQATVDELQKDLDGLAALLPTPEPTV